MSRRRNTSPVEFVSRRGAVETWTVIGVELRVPATMTLYQRVFLRLDVQRTTDVALVVPDHQVAFHLTRSTALYIAANIVVSPDLKLNIIILCLFIYLFYFYVSIPSVV